MSERRSGPGPEAPDALALHGGEPVRRELLPYARQRIDDEDVAAVVAVLRSDFLTTGPEVAAFEADFAAAVGARFAVAVSSGTAALHAAAFAAGIAPGDEAIVPALTFCATANCVVYQGGTPRFTDVRDDTLNLDPAGVEALLGPRTRALFAVDYAGHPAELDALRRLARERGLVLVDDASHAVGARLAGRPLGSLADLTTFSFHPAKHMTTFEGGMVTTDDPELERRLRRFRTHGIESDPNARREAGEWTYAMTELGYNYRLSDVACALGRSQLRKLDANLARRRAVAARYLDALADLPGLRLPTVLPDAEPAWHLFPIRIVADAVKADRREVFRALRAEGLAVNVHYIPVHLFPYYREHYGTGRGLCPVAETAYDALISLPLFHGMSDADADDVIAAVRKVLGHYAR